MAVNQQSSALVNTTKYSSVNTTKYSSECDHKALIRQHRAENYRLKSIAEGLLLNHANRHGVSRQYPEDFHRTIKCLRRPVSSVSVHKSLEHGKAFYSGLMRCGSVWSCPVCAEKIQARRAEEILKMFLWAYANGYKVVMLTLTWPHTKFDDLAEMMDKHSAALKLLRGGEGWVNFKQKYGYFGLIRSLEITHGSNGWHPHTHELLIVDKTADAECMEADIKQRWEKCCLKTGLLNEAKIDDFRKHAVDLIDNAQSSDYLTKQNAKAQKIEKEFYWGADKEVAKASTKKGKDSGKSPFQILADAEGEAKNAKLFVTYSLVMHGKRQLFWTKGLKKEVGLTEKSDQELVNEQTDKADLLATLTKEQWKIVLDKKARAEILDVAETRGLQGLRDWFAPYGQSLS